MAEWALTTLLPSSANPPSLKCQLPAWQYTRHVPFWQFGSKLPTTLHRVGKYTEPKQNGQSGVTSDGPGIGP